MFEGLNINMKRVYPMIVVSTMSSGKSTLINALAGKELLPNRNTACTAKAVAILDNDLRSKFRMYAIDNENKYHLIEDVSPEEIEIYNETDTFKELIIEGEVQGIRNSKKALLIIDTPGVNNSMNKEHGDITKNVLDECTEGLILYVLNAEQIGTTDDDILMNLVTEKLKDSPELNIIFAVNKMDSVNPAKEKPAEYINNCKKYISQHGFENPVIVPVSSRAALIFKKILAGQSLSETEEEDFPKAYKTYKRDGFSLSDYVLSPEKENGSDILKVDGNQYTRAEINAALEGTGFLSLEEEIDNSLIEHVKMRAPRVTKKKINPNDNLNESDIAISRANLLSTFNEIIKQKENE